MKFQHNNHYYNHHLYYICVCVCTQLLCACVEKYVMCFVTYIPSIYVVVWYRILTLLSINLARPNFSSGRLATRPEAASWTPPPGVNVNSVWFLCYFSWQIQPHLEKWSVTNCATSPQNLVFQTPITPKKTNLSQEKILCSPLQRVRRVRM